MWSAVVKHQVDRLLFLASSGPEENKQPARGTEQPEELMPTPQWAQQVQHCSDMVGWLRRCSTAVVLEALQHDASVLSECLFGCEQAHQAQKQKHPSDQSSRLIEALACVLQHLRYFLDTQQQQPVPN